MITRLPGPVRQHLAALRALLVLTVLLGVLYPLVVLGIGQLVFPAQANGSLVSAGGRVIGSSLLGQAFVDLIKSIDARRAAVAAFDGVSAASVPPDALTASASGLDPDISPAYADEQVTRVARARGLDPAAVRALVAAHVQDRTLGILG
jgi:K+-transporting ATPase ATPase C chain